jgi:hypothetical protein
MPTEQMIYCEEDVYLGMNKVENAKELKTH